MGYMLHYVLYAVGCPIHIVIIRRWFMGIVLHDTYGYLRYVLVPVGEVFYGYGAAVPQRLVSVPRYLR